MRHLAGIGLAVALVGLLVVGGVGAALAQEAAPPHENPEEVDEDGDQAALQRWFGGRMGEIHVDCSEGMAVGDFDACEDLDEEYESHLERYVTVERETTREASERRGEQFEETRTEQRELAERVREFEETRREYEEARAEGDEGRARELAREMRRRADRIEALGANVSRGFRALDGASGTDLLAAANATNRTVAETGRTAQAAEAASLTPVSFDVESDAVASVGSPATVSGVVATRNGSAVREGEIVVRDGAGARATATLESDGSWAVEYRPIRAETGETALSVTYVPEPASPYVGATATTNVTVEATTATVDLAGVDDGAAYDETVTARGRLTAADRPVAGVPVTLRVDGRVLGTARTDGDGAFAVAGSLPADVPAGTVPVTVEGGEAETAVAPGTASRSLSVASTATSLSATAEHDGETATVSGRLTTDDGEPVAERPVTVGYDGGTRSVRTNDDGYYSVVVERADGGEEAVVRYASAGGNLEGSRASVAVEPYTGSGSGFGGIGAVSEDLGLQRLADSLWALATEHPVLSAFAGLAILAAVATGLLVVRQYIRRRRGTGAAGGAVGADADLEPAIRPVTDDASGGLESARRHLESAPSTAVQLAHSTVRSALGVDDSRTHWEVYHAVGDDLDEERRAALRTVTEAFEAATFSPGGVDSERARAALADAERCLSRPDGGVGDGDGDGE